MTPVPDVLGWLRTRAIADAAEELARLRAENGELRRLLTRYRDETPLGHQPHMIAHQADEALGRGPNVELTGAARHEREAKP